MRILIYGLNYSPELTGIGKYTGELAAWLARRGHEVRVVTAPPYYPAWKVREDYRGLRYRKEHGPGEPTVYRAPLYVPEQPTGMNRIVHLVSFVLSSFPLMLRQAFWQPELVFTVEPTFFGVPLALFVAKSAGASTWLHVQDFEVDAAFLLGLLPAEGPIHDGALRIEKFFTFAFDCVSGVSARMVERAIGKGIPESRAVLFPNWVDTNQIYPLSRESRPSNRVLRELGASSPGIENKTVLLYSGAMGAKQGVERLAHLAEALADDPNVHFVFCGEGSFRLRLEALVQKLGNVSLLPLQPIERLNELLNCADIHLLPQRASAADLVMPSRLSAMLASGRPVIATADPGTELANVVEGRGLVVQPEHEEDLQTAARRLCGDAALRATFGEAARSYAEANFCKDAVLAAFEEHVLQLVEHRVPLQPRYAAN